MRFSPFLTSIAIRTFNDINNMYADRKAELIDRWEKSKTMPRKKKKKTRKEIKIDWSFNEYFRELGGL